MKIGVLCAADRGRRFLEHLIGLVPEAKFIAFSFREEPHEPPFLDQIRALADSAGATFVETRHVERSPHSSVWENAECDLLLVVGWRYLIPPLVYQSAPLGTYVFHDSLLPKYRGFSPTVWAMINGEKETGITLFEIDERVDAGDIVAQATVPIHSTDTIMEVTENVTLAGLRLLESSLPMLMRGNVSAVPQNDSEATYTCKRLPEDNEIDWREPTHRIRNLVRATSVPYPGAFTSLNGRRLVVWAAEALPDVLQYAGRVPGRIVDVRPGGGAVVLSGDGALLVTQVQLDGDSQRPASEVLSKISYTLGR